MRAELSGERHGQDHESSSSSLNRGNQNTTTTGSASLVRASLAHYLQCPGRSTGSEGYRQAYRDDCRHSSPGDFHLQSTGSHCGGDARQRRSSPPVYDAGRRASVLSALFQPSRAWGNCHRRRNQAGECAHTWDMRSIKARSRACSNGMDGASPCPVRSIRRPVQKPKRSIKKLPGQPMTNAPF